MPSGSVPLTLPPYEEPGGGCSTPNLDSAQAVALPYYGNNQVIENYLVQNGYDNLPYISFPSSPALRTTGSSTSFLEPNFLIPINVYIYRDGGNNPNSSITEIQAREIACMVNTIYRDASTAIQFYVNRVEFEANNFFNQEVSTNLHVYDLWSRKRYIPDNSKGINVHFIRYNNEPQSGLGKASLPHYPVLPYTHYSCYVRTHNNPAGTQRNAENIAATLAHEIGHTLGLLHTHHPGRLPSLAFKNEENATISNGCYQESVSRVKRNYWYDGCLGTDNKLKCEINGDFLCDTDADPNQIDNVTGCVYNHPASGDFREDNWGDLWTPPTRNVMSYTTADCRDEFSRHQTGIMWMQMPHLKNFINYQVPQITSSSNIVCTGSGLQFALSGTLPNDADVTWEAEPAYLFSVSGGTGASATLVAANSNVRGTGTIIFTLIGPGNCFIARIQKSVWVGMPSVDVINFTNSENEGMYFCSNSYGNYFELESETPTSYFQARLLDVTGQTVLYTSPTNYQANAPYLWSYYPSGNGYYIFEARGTNECGSASWVGTEIEYIDCGAYGMFTVYPNPTANTLTIENVRKRNGKGAQSICVEIVNGGDGALVFSQSLNLDERPIQINTSGIPNGYYLLKVAIGETVEFRRIKIEH